MNFGSLARGVACLNNIRKARLIIAAENLPEWEQDLDPETNISG